MPRYTPNQANNAATREAFPLDTYEMIIGEPKPFFGAGKEIEGGGKKDDNYGIRYILTIAEGPFAGKKYIKNCFMHSEGSADMTKQFMLAAHGFKATSDDEKLFNEKIVNMDQAFNTEDNSCGDYWSSVKGSRILVDLSVKMYQDQPQNQEKNWRPVGE